MGRAIGLREDFDGSALRRLARTSKSAPQARRLLALAEIYDGGQRSDAARIGGVTLQIIRDWVIRFNASGPDGLLDGKAPGKRSILNDAQRRALVPDLSPAAGIFPDLCLITIDYHYFRLVANLQGVFRDAVYGSWSACGHGGVRRWRNHVGCGRSAAA